MAAGTLSGEQECEEPFGLLHGGPSGTWIQAQAQG